jgi:hypothetical protein
MLLKKFIYISIILLTFTLALNAQVLGSCGGDSEKTPAISGTQKSNNDLQVQAIPLPGQYAIDFELPAVVGDDIKSIKLSDYNGKWRVVCFFPAAFTFV